MVRFWVGGEGDVSRVGGGGAGSVRDGAGVAAVGVFGGLPRVGFAIALCMFMGFMVSVSFHDMPATRLGPAEETSWEPAGAVFLFLLVTTFQAPLTGLSVASPGVALHSLSVEV